MLQVLQRLQPKCRRQQWTPHQWRKTPLPALSSCCLETVFSSTYIGEANMTLGSVTIVTPLNWITSSCFRAWKEAMVQSWEIRGLFTNYRSKGGLSPAVFFLGLEEMVITIGVGHSSSSQPLKISLLLLSQFRGINVCRCYENGNFFFLSFPHIVQPFLWNHQQIHSDLFLRW